MSGILKRLVKLIVVFIVLVFLYAVGLSFHIVPANWIPSALFKEDYVKFKQDLSNNIAASSATSSISKSVLDYLNQIEQSYASGTHQEGSQPTDGAAEQPQGPKSAIDKAREGMQQYQNAIDEQKKQLDSL